MYYVTSHTVTEDLQHLVQSSGYVVSSTFPAHWFSDGSTCIRKVLLWSRSYMGFFFCLLAPKHFTKLKVLQLMRVWNCLWFAVLEESVNVEMEDERGKVEEEENEVTSTRKRGQPRKRTRKTPGNTNASIYWYTVISAHKTDMKSTYCVSSCSKKIR